MKFERLNVPAWPLPDLVAFNERVHGVIDPWWARVWVRRIAWLFAALFALFAAMWLYFASTLPSAQYLLSYQPPLPTNIRGYDGTPVQTFARERRVNLSYDEYPPVVIHAFISAEDKTFFQHHGIDFTGLVGAVADYATKTVTGGGRARGGSTITQQVAKGLLRDSSYNIGRKVREAILAFRLESVLTKQQILELYLNQIFLGRNAYGVQAAARAYFDKDVGDLTLPEAAYLAVLPKAPANYDPERATARALDRRNYVLREMYRNGYITEDQWKSAAATGLEAIRYGAGEHFLDMGGYYIEEVRREILKRFGETENGQRKDQRQQRRRQEAEPWRAGRPRARLHETEPEKAARYLRRRRPRDRPLPRRHRQLPRAVGKGGQGEADQQEAARIRPRRRRQVNPKDKAASGGAVTPAGDLTKRKAVLP